jgi:nicotinate-nucleotide pyrophosphorylase (carboxylating)
MELAPDFLENKAHEEFLLLLEQAVQEDINGLEDLASSSIFDKQSDQAVIISRQDGVISGIDLLAPIFHRFSSAMEVRAQVFNGQEVKKGQVIAKLSGDTRSLLKAERIALNFLGFLSGIATRTEQFVKASQYKVQIIDTRKTLPAYRHLSKMAVGHGGGANHRYGLWDLAMLKDNHIDAAGSISAAVKKVKTMQGEGVGIEVECRNLEEVTQAIKENINLIMLDNMSPEDCTKASSLLKESGKLASFWLSGPDSPIKGPVSILEEEGIFLEASGDMSLERIPSYLDCGIHFISVGELTHSSANFNCSLLIGGNAE